MTLQFPWDRLRAALDGWEAPRGLRLRYEIDERSGRLATSLMTPCGGGEGWDFSLGRDEHIDYSIARILWHLDYSAVDLLRDHMCCDGRPPRALAYGERAFRRWVGRYRHALDARRARRASPWR